MPDTSSNSNHTAVVEHYARIAPKYDQRWDRYTRRTLEAVADRIGPVQTGEPGAMRLLDVACGTGRLEEMILKTHPASHITGVDLSPEMIEMARKRLPERAAPNVKLLVAPAEKLPVSDASFDLVICANAFHLVADPQKTLAEFWRVLRPGGRLIIIDWCREYPTMAAVLIGSRLFGRQYRRIETVRGLSRTLAEASFTVTHAEKFKATWFWGLMCIVAEKEIGDRS